MIPVVLFCFVAGAFAQYQGQSQHRAYQQQPQYQEQPQPAYQQQPAYQSQQQQRVFNPAAVHYVNIGTQLQGDYKFGYDTGKGNDGQSFREETRLPDGSVQGAYGYVDAAGKQRIVRYTAGKDGYKAEGDVGPEGVPRGIAPGPAPQAPADPHGGQQGGYGAGGQGGYGAGDQGGYGAGGQGGYGPSGQGNYVGNGYQQY